MTLTSQLPLALSPAIGLGVTAAISGSGAAAVAWAYTVFAPGCQFWAPVIRSLPSREQVSLTFDDGPHPEFTPAILEVLAEYSVQATFFVIGRHGKKYPRLLQQIVGAGHTIGNHSFDHDRFGVNRNLAYWTQQLVDTQHVVADATGMPPLLFRPPMGFKTKAIAAASRELLLPIIGWSVRSLDTRQMTSDQIAGRVLKRTSGHDILLMHDGLESAREVANMSQRATVEALPQILEGIREKRLTCVSLLDALRPAKDPAIA